MDLEFCFLSDANKKGDRGLEVVISESMAFSQAEFDRWRRPCFLARCRLLVDVRKRLDRHGYS